MKRKTKRFLSLFLSVPMTLSLIVTPVSAEPTDDAEGNVVDHGSGVTENKPEEKPAAPVTTVEDSYFTYTINADKLDFSDVSVNAAAVDEEVVVDEDDPTITVVEEELKNMTVLNEDGEPVKLTEEQIQTVLYMYSQYQDQWKANADVLGVQSPFYLQYNDKGEDGLGVLGEMLVLANVTVEDVRSGNYTYDDLTGMIMNFLYGDKLGIEYYGQTIKNKRDAALKAVKNSGATTDVQKMLVLNNWIAQNNTFDMAYIMNSGKEDPVMEAENPQKHPHYDDIYNEMYAVYEKQIGDQFRTQIEDGIKADMRQQYYEQYIWNIVYQMNLKTEPTDTPAPTEEPTPDPSGEPTPDPSGEPTPDPSGEPTPDPSGEPTPDPSGEPNPTGEVKAQAEEEKDPEASAAADAFMEEHKEAIAADAPKFVAENISADISTQMVADADAFIKDIEENGVPNPDNPEQKIPLDAIVEDQMENNRDIQELPETEPGSGIHMTPNEAVPVFADQGAQGLTNGIIGYWSGNHFGALAEGKSVCLGYSKAYAYLLQCMYPEYYGINGAGTDMTVASNWKEAKDLYYDENGELDINKDYNVDLIRITFDADVTMYGEVQENFNSDHFWNAVKVDGKWYYVDPCYTDVYSEVMNRDRVETDGFMNHMYFMFSHTSATKLYEGYYSEIKGLYDTAATNKEYEDAWVSRIKSDPVSDGKAFYYLYDSTDMISMLEDFNNSQNNYEEMDMDDAEYKLVRHAITNSDTGNGDTDYETLIEFNYKANEDDENSVARVYNPETKALEENEMLTKLYARHEEESKAYPSIHITTALSNNKIFFNLSNCILSYDLASGEVALVKEYNKVSAVRDKTKDFGGMAFSIVDNAENAEFTVENHPIAAISLKEDGKLYVSIATNLAYISGKDAHNSEDNSSFGYEFEESNFNPDYNSYGTGDYSDEQLEQMGYTKEKNDNDEFMWVANFVGTEDMSHLAGGSHTYEEVTMEASCGRNAYTENRCTSCGASENGSRVESEETACKHHYIHFDEEYYTKDDNGNWNTGDCYVCTVCGFAIEEPVEPKENSMGGNDNYEERKAQYEKEKAIYDDAVATAGHTYAPTDAKWSEDSTSVTFSKMECSSVCPSRKTTLDCLLNDKTIAVELGEAETAEAEVTGHEGDCTTGATVIYTASGEVNNYKYTAVNKVAQEPGKHSYTGEFTWTEVLDEEEKPTGAYTATATLKCGVCGNTQENVEAVVAKDEENSTAPACETAGKDVFTATATVKDEEGNEIGSAVDTKEVDIPATGHKYKDGVCEVCGQEEPSVEAPAIESVYSKKQTTVKVTWSKVEDAYGYQLYRADSFDAAEDAWTLVKTIKGDDVEKFTNEGNMQYTNVDLEVGKTYYYKVRAFKMKTGATDDTDEASRLYSDFSAINYMPAAVVFDNVYSNSTSRVRMLWNQVKGAHGYQIWRMNDDGTYSIVKTLGDKNNILTNDQGATTAYSNTGLEAGKTYTYKMRAFSIFEGEKKVFGAYSDEVKVAVMPETPKLTVTSSKEGRAVLNWNKVNGAAGYQVWMSESADGTYSIIKSIKDGAVESYTKYDLKSGSTYFFKIRAYTELDGKKTFGAYADAASVKVK